MLGLPPGLRLARSSGVRSLPSRARGMFTGGVCVRFGSVCRLLGLTAGTSRVRVTFWLLDAPDSLEVQSPRNVDGAGLGYFGPDSGVVLDKQPEPAFRD